MGLNSFYVFDHSDFRGNFTFTNLPNFAATFSVDETNLGSTSTLNVARETREISIDLYDLFNSGDFLYLIDIKPLIDGVSSDNNEDALMVLISNGMKHYGYRNSDIRSGWMEWRYIPYHDKQPGRHQESDLLNQIAFDIHVDRGTGTVDNDGWIGFYYFFFLDGAGRLGAFVDGWAFHCGGGGGMQDGGPNVGDILNMVLPQFLAPVQSFLDSFCATAGLSAPGLRGSGGRALLDRIYLLPGNGSKSFGAIDPSGTPAPGIGNSVRPVENEVSLALLPRQKKPLSIPLDAVVTQSLKTLKRKGWHIEVSDSINPNVPKRTSAGDTFVVIRAYLKNKARTVSNAEPSDRPRPKKAKENKKPKTSR